ncbi:MAG: histidine--tRNA ligase [Deltaproteobacteria bacterium]|nr:histidine--tRNA ligase [Deltaproteobacteria bacterium]
METLRAPKGMNDLFESDLVSWRHLEATVREVFLAYGFGEVRTPLVEEAELFIRGVGEGTDIVGKEMFLFTDRDPKHPKQLCLRPENTAGVVRAMIENGKIVADAFWKVFYLGAQFRNERPQAGRYRQFHQLGCEVLGYAEPAADVEVIAAAHTLLTRLGITDVKIHLSSIGDVADRPRYREALLAYLRPHAAALSEDSKRRLDTNPLRILDSKDEGDQKLCADAPKPMDFLSDEARGHFDAVKAGLDRLGIPYVIDPLLVRGLDYYTRTVFELKGSHGLGSQSTVMAGGRYDGLVAELGGRPTPAVGFAGGIERLLMVMKALGHSVPAPTPALMLIGADEAGAARCAELAFALRRQGVGVEADLRGRSVKAQMRHADRSGARFTAVVGSSEIERGGVSLKNMAAGSVATVPLSADELAQAVRGSA